MADTLPIGSIPRHSENALARSSCVTALGLSETSSSEDIAFTGKTGVIWRLLI